MALELHRNPTLPRYYVHHGAHNFNLFLLFLSLAPSLARLLGHPRSTTMAGSSRDPHELMLLFHTQERDLYCRLVRQLGQNPERMKQVIALWLWFESIDHYEFIQRVSSYKGDDVILGFVREAEACLDRLMDQREQTRGDELPLTSYLIAEKMDLRFFESHRDDAIKGVRSIFDNVCQIIFDDVLVERAAEAANHPDDHHLSTSGLHDIKQPAREGSSQEEGSASSAAVAVSLPAQTHTVLPPRGSTLNPMALPWSPEINRSPEDLRSMFITFSRGYPISRADIVEFFNERYGRCLETVMMERASPGQQPMYGRLVFRNASTIARVLNGQRTAKFLINGRHLWARMYTPRRG
ncbi:hypothetical protein BHM03_00022653 [Ensete ventricosum]|uniref:RRM domain-containing protein n=1 Tax=Ensete ventricosum TaxID=4639 RepID=A0A445MGB0_ENSVE|nr:hypothetical protein BHM03_00022653 [Ensete ventricosum]